MTRRQRLPALAAALALLLASCTAPDAATASAMHLRRTEGVVGVSDGQGQSVTPAENLGLYSGYQVATQSESYAWIDLDSVKLTKLDENSEVSIQTDGKLLEVEVTSGSLFFNITEPLDGGESLSIRTSSMVVGIRGTCGWVTQSAAFLLEGTVTAAAGEERVTVTAGEMAVLTADGGLSVTQYDAADIPSFVLTELEQDEDLAAAILEDSGLDVRNPPQEPDAAAANEAAHAAYEAVLAEYRDAKENALPYDEYDPETDGNYEINRANYPLLGPCWYYMEPEYPLCYACYDLDGNGVDELAVAAEWSPGALVLLEIYAFDGTNPVPLSDNSLDRFFWVYFSEVTADGLFIDIGNGATTSNHEYRLSGDGFSLEPAADSGVPGGVNIDDVDLSPYGGALIDRVSWIPLESRSLSGENDAADD